MQVVYSYENQKMLKETSSYGGDQLTTPGPQKDEISYRHSIAEKRKLYKRNPIEADIKKED